MTYSGTITAFLTIRSDANIVDINAGFVKPMQITLTVVPAIHNPEPRTFVLIGGALVGLALIRRKR